MFLYSSSEFSELIYDHYFELFIPAKLLSSISLGYFPYWLYLVFSFGTNFSILSFVWLSVFFSYELGETVTCPSLEVMTLYRILHLLCRLCATHFWQDSLIWSWHCCSLSWVWARGHHLGRLPRAREGMDQLVYCSGLGRSVGMLSAFQTVAPSLSLGMSMLLYESFKSGVLDSYSPPALLDINTTGFQNQLWGLIFSVPIHRPSAKLKLLREHLWVCDILSVLCSE